MKKNFSSANTALATQNALEYMFYMILASKFKKSTCKNPIIEKRLRIDYNELGNTKQCRGEETIINYLVLYPLWLIQ